MASDIAQLRCVACYEANPTSKRTGCVLDKYGSAKFHKPCEDKLKSVWGRLSATTDRQHVQFTPVGNVKGGSSDRLLPRKLRMPAAAAAPGNGMRCLVLVDGRPTQGMAVGGYIRRQYSKGSEGVAVESDTFFFKLSSQAAGKRCVAEAFYALDDNSPPVLVVIALKTEPPQPMAVAAAEEGGAAAASTTITTGPADAGLTDAGPINVGPPTASPALISPARSIGINTSIIQQEPAEALPLQQCHDQTPPASPCAKDSGVTAPLSGAPSGMQQQELGSSSTMAAILSHLAFVEDLQRENATLRAELAAKTTELRSAMARLQDTGRASSGKRACGPSSGHVDKKPKSME
ncbi:hypothetical protein HXX76_009688 [Chlamydomonas incerta]|uniref:Uncharacterized protein n=1 Tax=Chlamydomonas incerta TaxID=51695 RepID=A0A835VZ25_CHLIN|nr:hypothetical protein HXX76_009688 [Chlamydomonas incerta]|eukprot:KAG2431158.1 hypothetical protein HXX76_009688 [Chlamydomonas incerta]